MINRSLFASWNRLLTLGGICSLIVVAATASFASDDNNTGNALEMAKVWVAKIDAGDYEGSYLNSSSLMHEKVPENKWLLVMKTLRTPWGTVVSRRVTSHVYKPDGYLKEPGEFMIVSYDTSFKNLADAEEVIVLKRENGKWCAAGYNGGPKQQADTTATDSSNAPTTETETLPHVKTPQQ